MKDLIRLLTKNSDNYDEKYMKIKFNSEDDLSWFVFWKIKKFCKRNLKETYVKNWTCYYFDDTI